MAKRCSPAGKYRKSTAACVPSECIEKKLYSQNQFFFIFVIRVDGWPACKSWNAHFLLARSLGYRKSAHSKCIGKKQRKQHRFKTAASRRAKLSFVPKIHFPFLASLCTGGWPTRARINGLFADPHPPPKGRFTLKKFSEQSRRPPLPSLSLASFLANLATERKSSCRNCLDAQKLGCKVEHGVWMPPMIGVRQRVWFPVVVGMLIIWWKHVSGQDSAVQQGNILINFLLIKLSKFSRLPETRTFASLYLSLLFRYLDHPSSFFDRPNQSRANILCTTCDQRMSQP